MSAKKQIMTVVLLCVAVVTFGGWLSGMVGARNPDYYQEVRRNINIFGRVYEEIAKRYVEDIEPDKFMRAGIDGMLGTLDPYTVFVEKEENADLQIMTSGKYGGVGMPIGMRNGWPTVVEPPFEGTPALKAGIREGDQIIEVEGQSTQSMKISDTAARLRGEKGTEVTIKIRREGEPEPLTFRLIRDEIEVKDVTYAGLVKDGIGYIKLRRFSRNAGAEVDRAIRDLKSKGLKALVLDLRYNPGGLLEAAVEVGQNFIKKGDVIVSTKGRVEGSVQEYRSEREPVLGDLPLVVLVNGYSASASEIVAGAVQDLDRGVIIGSETFGKGLVQTVVPISQETALKITTAKYYMPSGRLIQRALVAGKEEPVVAEDEDQILPAPEGKDQKEKSDAAVEYKTTGGRIVRGGGGITPDVKTESEKLNLLEIELLRKSMLFNFAVVYAAKHSNLTPGFVVDDQLVADFRAFLKDKGFTFKTEGQAELEKLEKVAQEGGFAQSIDANAQNIQRVLEEQKEKEFQSSLSFIKQGLEREVAAKLWGTSAEIEASFDDDKDLQKAVEILSSPQTYAAILQRKTVGG